MVAVGMLDLKHPEKNLKAYPFACVAKAEGINFFCFKPSDVDLESKTIHGYYYENGSWVIKQTLFPDVVYNSNSHAKSEQDQIVIEALRFLIPFTSYPVGNKMKVFEMLGKSKTFASYLPETKEVENVNSTIDLINQRKNIILKPRNGRKGHGIIFISCKEDMYELTQENETKQLTKTDLVNLVEELLPKTYIAQQYVKSKKKKGIAYDLRLHVQKDGLGEWKICTIYPRIAPHDNIKTNISSGGATLYLAPFLEQEFNEEYYNMKRYLEVFSLSIAKEMDKIYEVSFDELGIDIGIDENNKIWLYEINWHPGVPPTFYLELDVVKTSLEYCCYLTHKCLNKSSHHAFRPVIAVTGSAGKTTTKSMIASVLRERLNIFESKDNCTTSENTRKHINEITPFHQAAVLEYAMGHEGVIARHCSFIKPHISIVTNIGPSHIANFNNGIREIAKAKSEIIKGMDRDGILIINGDDLNSKFLEIEQFKGTIIKVGTNNDCDFQAMNVQFETNGISFNIDINGKKSTTFVPASGIHNLYNSLFAVAVGVHLGLSSTEILEGLKKYRNPKGRLELHNFNDEITVIDDTCHATFEAMKSAVEVLHQHGKNNRKKIAVLGTMPELGEMAIEYHKEIGKLLFEKEVDKLITFGTNTRYYRNGAIEAGFPAKNIFSFYNLEKLNKFLEEIMCSDTVFLFKGARRIGLNKSVEKFISYIKSEKNCDKSSKT